MVRDVLLLWTVFLYAVVFLGHESIWRWRAYVSFLDDVHAAFMPRRFAEDTLPSWTYRFSLRRKCGEVAYLHFFPRCNVYFASDSNKRFGDLPLFAPLCLYVVCLPDALGEGAVEEDRSVISDSPMCAVFRDFDSHCPAPCWLRRMLGTMAPGQAMKFLRRVFLDYVPAF